MPTGSPNGGQIRAGPQTRAKNYPSSFATATFPGGPNCQPPPPVPVRDRPPPPQLNFMPSYHPQRIEPKWQAYWERNKTFRTPGPRPGQAQALHPRHVPLPQRRRPARRPSRGLHRHRHPLPLQADARVQRPAPDGLGRLRPARRAVRRSRPSTHPRITTQANIDTFRRQIKSLGFSLRLGPRGRHDRPGLLQVDPVDLPAALSTPGTTPIRLDRRRAGRTGQGRPIAELPIPRGRRPTPTPTATRSAWPIAPRCRSTGARRWARCWPTRRSSTASASAAAIPVVRMPLKQWMLRITAYAERLVDDLELRRLAARHQGHAAQLGRPERGGRGRFPVGDDSAWQDRRRLARAPDDVIRVFTTRPDTLFGATYMVLAPEHPLVDRLTTPEHARPRSTPIARPAARKSDLDRTDLAKTKTGVFTGGYADQPGQRRDDPDLDRRLRADGLRHRRDHGRARPRRARLRVRQAFDLPIVRVVAAGRLAERGRQPRSTAGRGRATGVAVNSRNAEIASTACRRPRPRRRSPPGWRQQGLGRKTVNYKLRDWLFSRQRYWGEPFPILLERRGRPRPDAVARVASCPSALPDLDDFKPTGKPEPPLGKATDWVRYSRRQATAARPTRCPSGPGSCWYYLRYLDPKNDRALWDPEKEKYWMPVDLYVGGAEHAVLHLLYSRFWHKVLFDRGHVSTPEPFQRLVNQGMILGETEFTGYQDERRATGSPPIAGRARTTRRSPSDGEAAPTPVEAVKLDRGPGRQEGRRLRPGRRPDDPDRRPRPQDVEEPGQRHQPRRRSSRSTAPTACGSTRCSWARSRRSSPGA